MTPGRAGSAGVDRALLEELRQEAEVQTSTAREGFGDYVSYLLRRISQAVQDVIEAILDRVGLDNPGTQRFLAQLLVGLAIAVTVLALARWLYSLWRRRRRSHEPDLTVEATTAPEGKEAPPWRQWIEERLAAGNTEGALEALWWWFSSALVGRTPEASWTTGDVLRRSGRREFRPWVAELDRLRFARSGATPEAVRSLLTDLERTLP